MNNRKQLKITKLFKKSASRVKVPDECDEIVEEVRQLEEKLADKQSELFQIQRNQYKQKLCPLKKTSKGTFDRPEKTILSNSVNNLKSQLQLMSMLTGVEVQSYDLGDHCCIVFHMQHNTDCEIKHGLRIDLHSEDSVVSKMSLPVGFNLDAVTKDFENIMILECISAIRNALVAYYNRLEQFHNLKKLINMDSELFKALDGSHIEIKFYIQSDLEEQFEVNLILNYSVYDIRPQSYSIKESVLPEEVCDILLEQCRVFKHKPLQSAFKDAFLDDVGTYRLVQQMGVRNTMPKRKEKRFRPNKHNNNDDTFLPEDCSDQGEDNEEY